MGYSEFFLVGPSGNEEYHTQKDGVNYLINIPPTVVSTWSDDELYVNETSGITFASLGTSEVTAEIHSESITWNVANAQYKILEIYDNSDNYITGIGFIVDDGSFTVPNLQLNTTYKAVLKEYFPNASEIDILNRVRQLAMEFGFQVHF